MTPYHIQNSQTKPLNFALACNREREKAHIGKKRRRMPEKHQWRLQEREKKKGKTERDIMI